MENASYFFLLGYAKSGTNWLGNLLNLHPHILCRGEFHFQVFFKAFEDLKARRCLITNEPHSTQTILGLQDTVRRTLAAGALEQKPTAKLFGDRSPRWFGVLLPDTPHIYIVRDGRDVLVSFTYHHLKSTHIQNLSFAPKDVVALAEQFGPRFREKPDAASEVVREILEVPEWTDYVAEQWARQTYYDCNEIENAKKSGLPLYIMRYELLHKDTRAEQQQVYSFLGLDPELAEEPSTETKTAPGFVKVNPLSHYRKGAIGDWQEHFSPKTTARFHEVAGKALQAWGYE